MDCTRCVGIHGPGLGCFASFTDAVGKAVCVFCADGVPCPVQQRIIALPRSERSKWLIERLKQRTKSQEDRMNGTKKGKFPVPASPATASSAATTKRTCKVVGCEAELAHNNTTGFCHEHLGRSQNDQWRRRSKDNGAAHHHAHGTRARDGAGNATGATVSKPDRPANTYTLAIAERVDLVLWTIPPEEKARMVAAWLAGERTQPTAQAVGQNPQTIQLRRSERSPAIRTTIPTSRTRKNTN